MATEVIQSGDPDHFEPKYRIDEEYEYYTELATNASQLWIESILRKRLPHQDDFRKSLEDGTILCELLNTLRPGCIKKINRLSSKIAGIDNLTIFLQTCSDVFSLHEKQLFQVSDLEDLSERAIPANQLVDEQGKRIRRVLTTIYHLGKSATGLYDGSPIDFSAFTGIVAACTPPTGNGGTALNYNRESSVSSGIGMQSEDKVSRSDSRGDSPVSSSTTKTPSVVRQNTRASDQSPTRLSDAGSLDSSSNLSSSNTGTQSKEPTTNNGTTNQHNNRSSQNRTSQAHHFVKSGFSLPTGPSNLTKTAVEQMRLINESRSSAAFKPPVTKQASVGAKPATAEDDAWQSDLDMWRMKRKQSLQSEVLNSVGLMDESSDGSRLSDNSQGGSSNKKSNKKPGLLSKLRYSVELDSDDPIVVSVEEQARERTDSFSSFASSVKEQLPPIADTTDYGDEHQNGNQNEITSSPSESDKDGYKDLVFTISQAPGNLRGFGFSIKGGRDANLPLTVDRVTAGSAADETDVRADDEILKINSESVASYFRPTLNRLIQQCVKTGQIALTIRRYTRPPTSEPPAKPAPLQKSASVPTPLNNSNGKSEAKVADKVDNQPPRTSPRFGPGPLVMEQEIKVRSPEPLSTISQKPEVSDEAADQSVRSQPLAGKSAATSPAPAAISKLPVQQATSPALSSSSSSSNSANSASNNGQRYILGMPRGYRSSPNQQQPSVVAAVNKDDSIQSANDSVTSPRNTPANGSVRSNGSVGNGSAPGAVLVRGGTNNSSTSSINNDQNGVNGRSPFTQIPQPFTSPLGNSNISPSHQQPGGYTSPRNSVEKQQEIVSPKSEPAPQTPPQLPRSVSSRELCAACSQSLGAGPAMAIERLGLFYHVRCFRCSVCKISLSNGQTGVDVRVKGARLHCQNCNSSDESGLQSSQV